MENKNNLTNSTLNSPTTPQPNPQTPPSPAPQPNPQPTPQPNPQPLPNPTPQFAQQPQATNIPPQPETNPSTPKSPNHKTLIIISAIICLGIIGCIAAFLLLNNQSPSPNNQSDSSQTNSSTQENTKQLTKFEDLTKDEALAFLNSKTAAKGILPDGFVGDEIQNATIAQGNTIVSDLELIHSYDNIEELKELARENYRGLDFFLGKETENTEDSFEITEYDYYAIVTPNRIKEPTACEQGYYDDCNSLLSFKKQYLDYHLERTTSDGGPISTADAYYINKDLDPEVISQLLRIYIAVGVYSLNGHGNIYSYSFEEQNDKYLLTVNIVGAGMNLAMLDNSESYDSSNIFALNLYRRSFTVDKADGCIHLVKTNDSTMEEVKSIPISEEEYNSLRSYSEE